MGKRIHLFHFLEIDLSELEAARACNPRARDPGLRITQPWVMHPSCAIMMASAVGPNVEIHMISSGSFSIQVKGLFCFTLDPFDSPEQFSYYSCFFSPLKTLSLPFLFVHKGHPQPYLFLSNSLYSSRQKGKKI